MPSWVCPTCLTELNAAPYGPNERANQGNDHLKGKRHLRRMKAVDISNEDVYRRFCIKIGRSVPDFHATSPLHDFKDYTDQCGGNGELTIENFAAPPPPLPREEDGRRRSIKCTERNIYSEPFATVIPTDTTQMVGGSKCRVRMLCCWDDKRTCHGCVRENCPFSMPLSLLNCIRQLKTIYILWCHVILQECRAVASITNVSSLPMTGTGLFQSSSSPRLRPIRRESTTKR